MWGGQWADERICDRIKVNLAKSRAETIVRKATENTSPTTIPRNMAETFSKKAMVLDGETLKPKSTLPKTAPGDEHSAVHIRAILSFSGRLMKQLS